MVHGVEAPLLRSLRSQFGQIGSHGKIDNVLIVVAHPDDETMFFSPTIMRYAREPYVTHGRRIRQPILSQRIQIYINDI